MITIDGVSKSFGERSATPVRALTDISLEVAAGEFVSLIGASGCGKTTLLRLVAGIETPTTGTVRVDDGSPAVARAHKRIGFVPQSPALLPWRSVRDNARLLVDVNSRANDGRGMSGDRLDELLREVGLGDFLHAYPHELSGGMQQRVALVRAFALDASVLLLDEPFAALDEITRTEMRHLLARLWERSSTTVLFVTHSVAEAVYLSNRVGVMTPRPGTISATEEIGLGFPRRPDIENTTDFFTHVRHLREALADAHSPSGRVANGPTS